MKRMEAISNQFLSELATKNKRDGAATQDFSWAIVLVVSAVLYMIYYTYFYGLGSSDEK